MTRNRQVKIIILAEVDWRVRHQDSELFVSCLAQGNIWPQQQPHPPCRPRIGDSGNKQITQIFAVAIYVIYPSRQDLRPEVFPRDNLLTAIIGLLYFFDTNTGVCPSLHVAYSLGIASTWMREKSVGPMVKVLIWLFAILVCLSTMFIKQHSAVDFFAALPICLLAEYWVFHRKGTQKYETQNR